MKITYFYLFISTNIFNRNIFVFFYLKYVNLLYINITFIVINCLICIYIHSHLYM